MAAAGCGLCRSERARVVFPPLRPLTADCVLDAARISGMPVAALFAILATEGGKTGEALSNRNGTWDIGPFQVNTIHLNGDWPRWALRLTPYS